MTEKLTLLNAGHLFVHRGDKLTAHTSVCSLNSDGGTLYVVNKTKDLPVGCQLPQKTAYAALWNLRAGNPEPARDIVLRRVGLEWIEEL